MWMLASDVSPPKDGSWFLVWDQKSQWRDKPPVIAVRYLNGNIDSPPTNVDNKIVTNWSYWASIPPSPYSMRREIDA